MAGEADVLKNPILQNFLHGDPNVPLAANDSFSGRGIVDSTGILELASPLLVDPVSEAHRSDAVA